MCQAMCALFAWATPASVVIDICKISTRQCLTDIWLIGSFSMANDELFITFFIGWHSISLLQNLQHTSFNWLSGPFLWATKLL